MLKASQLNNRDCFIHEVYSTTGNFVARGSSSNPTLTAPSSSYTHTWIRSAGLIVITASASWTGGSGGAGSPRLCFGVPSLSTYPTFSPMNTTNTYQLIHFNRSNFIGDQISHLRVSANAYTIGDEWLMGNVASSLSGSTTSGSVAGFFHIANNFNFTITNFTNA